MATMTATPDTTAAAFTIRAGLRTGLVHTPGDPDYDRFRAAWNLALDQRPAAVAVPRTAGEICLVVREARVRGMRVAPQATGHGAAAMGDLTGTVLLRTDEMRGVTVDPVRRVARVEAGAQWQDVVPLAAQHGLRALHGSAPDVGVVGYTLGGGYSVYGRRHGLACEHVTAVDIVLGGHVVRATLGSHPELLRAIRRGAGAGLGVICAMEFELFAIERTQAGHLWFPAERGGEILDAWSAWAPQLPDTASSNARWLAFPPLPELPEHIRGQAFFLVEAVVMGDAADAAALLQPLRALEPAMDTVAEMDPVAMMGLHMDPPTPVPFRGDGCVLTALPAGAGEAIAAAHAAAPSLMLFQFCLAGAAQSRIPGELIVFAGGVVTGPEAAAAVGADLERVLAALEPYRADRDFANFREAPVAPEQLWDADTLRDARALRDAVDPRATVLAAHPL